MHILPEIVLSIYGTIYIPAAADVSAVIHDADVHGEPARERFTHRRVRIIDAVMRGGRLL